MRSIGHNDVIAQHTIVRYVTVRHNEVVVTDDGFAPGGRSSVNGYELAEHAVVTDDGPCLLALEFQVLWNRSDDGGWKDMTVISEDHIVIYIGECVNGDVLADLSFRAHIC